ncbi:MAG: general secretion pathway protein GspK [Nitrospirae bacterium]|nr:general secretion pathway protein GspK [Nitrospirota bacterium]
MMVLWVLVFLSILSMNFLRSTRWVTGSTHNLKEETLTYYQALSGYHEALHYIALDKDPQVDFLDEEGNFWIDSETNPVTGKRETEDGELEIKITDENALINLNFAQPDRLRKLLQRAGINEDDIIIIMDSVLDWKDLDKEHHLSGAEDDYYESLQDPYKTRNGLFTVPEELALVRGMKPEYLFGDGTGAAGLLSLITTFGKNTININTVSPEIMQFLGFNDVEIETIMKQRNKAYGGFRFIPQQFSSRGLTAMSTQTFRIEVTARTKNSPIGARITGIVSREPSAKGNELRTIYWRERAETVRT